MDFITWMIKNLTFDNLLLKMNCKREQNIYWIDFKES